MASTPEVLWWDEVNSAWRLIKELEIPEVAVEDMVNGTIYTIKNLGTTTLWTNFGAASPPTVGHTFVKSGSTGSGNGIVNGPGTYSGTNPILRCEISDVLGKPRSLKLLLANRSPKPFTNPSFASEVSEAAKITPVHNNQISMFQGLFPDFMYIRVRDSETHSILFAGRMYEKLGKYNGGEYGPELEIEAFDVLMDLAMADMAPFPDLELGTTGNYDRLSKVISRIIRDSVWKGGTTNGRSITYTNSDKFHDSDNAFTSASADKGYRFKGVKKTALKHIIDIAAQDYYADQAGELVFGYDFYADPEITDIRYSVAPPTAQLAYHKRLTEPTTDPEDDGLAVRYNTQLSTSVGGTPSTAGREYPMLQDYNFSDIPSATYTDFSIEYEEEAPFYGVEEQKGKIPPKFRRNYWDLAKGGPYATSTVEDVQQIVTGTHMFTILYCDIPTTWGGYSNGTYDTFKTAEVGNNSGARGLDSNGLFRVSTDPRCSITQASKLFTMPSDSTQIDSSFLGVVQYQSGTGDGQYIIISHTETDGTKDRLEALTDTQNLYEAVYAGGGGNGVKISLSGNAYTPNKLKIKRIQRLDMRGTSVNVGLMRIAIAQKISAGSSGSTVQRGYVGIPDFPHLKFTGTAQVGSTGSTLKPSQTINDVGIEKGCAVYFVNPDGSKFVGYIDAISSSSNVITSSMYAEQTLENSSPIAWPGWDVGDAYTIIIPLRAGSNFFADHRLQQINAKHLVTEMVYTWQYGRVHTELYSLGENEARQPLEPEDGWFPPGGGSSGPIFGKMNQNAYLENIRWIFSGTEGGVTFDYNTMGWDIPVGGSGSITLINKVSGSSYRISAANVTILDKVYMLYFDYQTSTTQFQIAVEEGVGADYIKKGHFIEIARLTIGEDKDRGYVNMVLLIGGDSNNSPAHLDGRKLINPNSLESTLLYKTIQPYKHDLVINPGDPQNASRNTKASISDGTITFADGTEALVPNIVTLDGFSLPGVKYIYFSIDALHKHQGTATIAWDASYLVATSDTRGLLAVATKAADFTATNDATNPLFNDEVAESNAAKDLSIMSFRGHTDTISCNLLAARAITSRHITTGQIIAKDFRTAAGVATGASGSPAGLWFNSTAIRGLSGGTNSYTDISASPSQVEFEIRAATGKAYFASGTIVLDCDGVNIWNAATYSDTAALRLRLDQDSGLKLRYGIATAIDFMEDVAGSNAVASISASGLGSTTYGGHSSANLLLTSDKLDVIINSLTQDIGLFPDPTHGYVKIGKSRGLAFMDSTSVGTGMHNSGTDWVGLRGPTVNSGEIEKSTMYILPEIDGTEEGKVLGITTDPVITGSGSRTAPYLATLEWVTAGGGAITDAFKVIDIDNDWQASGYNWGTGSVTASGEDVLYLVAGTGITLASDISQDTGSDGAPAIRISAIGDASLAANQTWTGNNVFNGASTSVTGTALSVSAASTFSGTAQTFTTSTYFLGGGILLQEEGSTSLYPTPPAGYGRVYVKAQNPAHLYFKNESGTEFDLVEDASVYTGGTGIDITSGNSIYLNLSELNAKTSQIDHTDFLAMVTDGNTTFKVVPGYIPVGDFHNDNTYALASHGTHDYDYWRLEGDEGGLIDNIISQETVDMRGYNGITTRVVTGGIQIDGADLSLATHTHSVFWELEGDDPSYEQITVSTSGERVKFTGGTAITTDRTTGGLTITNDAPGNYNEYSFKYVSISTAANQYTWGNNNSSYITADSTTDWIYLVPGDGITFNAATSGNDAIKISAHDHNSGNIITTSDIYCYGNVIDGNDNDCYIRLYSNYIQFFVNDSVSPYSRKIMDLDAYGSTAKGHIGINGDSSSSWSIKVNSPAQCYQTYASSYWANGSDERAKTNILSITTAVDTLKLLNPVSFSWKDSYLQATETEDRTYLGFVAQEYEQVFPNDITDSINDLIQLEDGSYELGEYSPKNDHRDPMPDGATMIMENMKTISPDSVVPYLVAAVKELVARIEVLEGI